MAKITLKAINTCFDNQNKSKKHTNPQKQKKMRTKIEKTVIKVANLLKEKGLFKTIQIILYGNNKNIAPKETKW